MIQVMRSHHRGFARNLLALWLVLLFACAFSHMQAAASSAMAAASLSLLSPAHSDQGDSQHDQGAADTGCSLQNAPFNQQLLVILAFTALFGLASSAGLLSDLNRQCSNLLPVPRLSPGLPTPVRKHLHRYNE
ncbi:hypothetical protein [Pseudomonas paeninsulae]|uniref:hypothetical protein n=1 Tax=Pseudomonas paeninsulae TaxID=3110772 RepID=UPI002D77CA0E|nr:hypothetical protein [Pseudomonas sp. IT1137]